MRSLVAFLSMIYCSIAPAFGEEAYQRTGKVLGRCVGEHLLAAASSRVSADVMDDYLKQKCGQLEEQEQNEFFDFFRKQIVCDEKSKRCTLPGETVAIIMAYIISPANDARRVAVQSYKDAILKNKPK